MHYLSELHALFVDEFGPELEPDGLVFADQPTRAVLRVVAGDGRRRAAPRHALPRLTILPAAPPVSPSISA